jgi:hypothetical protein
LKLRDTRRRSQGEHAKPNPASEGRLSAMRPKCEHSEVDQGKRGLGTSHWRVGGDIYHINAHCKSCKTRLWRHGDPNDPTAVWQAGPFACGCAEQD